MHAEERHQAILRRLREQGSLRVTDFADELGVSPVTVRRDVETLAERGLVARVHGGAVRPETRAETAGPGADTAPARLVPAPRTAATERVFGMIVPAADYYYPEVIKGAREAAGSRGIRLVLGISQYSPAEEQVQARQMLADGIDGLLITPCGSADDQHWLAELPIPFALVERRPENDISGAERAVTDHVYGARLAVRHLAESGRSKIALLLRDDSPHGPLVAEGYAGGLRAAGLTAPTAISFRIPSPSAMAERDRTIDEFIDAVTEGRVDAALVHNDHDAIVLLQRLRSRGLTVPGDLAIVAYDDEVAALADIPLTAVAPPKHAVGAAAVDLLNLRVTDPGRPRHRLAILPELHIRDSSG
ncbi:substrate-binding domain-containing protein [Streptomyces sp. NPDC050738]|uniref:substrate-binding domain-containing protein n=1 Tax=Streptomyces sp. NPDC050738 TaxID=3154744 RepID=UPI0034461D20